MTSWLKWIPHKRDSHVRPAVSTSPDHDNLQQLHYTPFDLSHRMAGAQIGIVLVVMAG